MRIIVSNFGKILRWESGAGSPILYPERTIRHPDGDKSRGGSFVCAPLFGSRPARAPWYLPPHGPVRTLTTAADLRYLAQPVFADRARGDWRFQFHFPAERGKFPWTYDVEVYLRLHRESGTLQQMMRVIRSSACDNDIPMPVSFGFHPYFDTQGEPYEISQDGAAVATHETDLGSSQQIPRGEGIIVLKTSRHQVKVKGSGYLGHYNLWTDSPKYVCIEPVGGKDTPFHLEPGQEVNGQCWIQCKENA